MTLPPGTRVRFRSGLTGKIERGTVVDAPALPGNVMVRPDDEAACRMELGVPVRKLEEE